MVKNQSQNKFHLYFGPKKYTIISEDAAHPLQPTSDWKTFRWHGNNTKPNSSTIKLYLTTKPTTSLDMGASY